MLIITHDLGVAEGVCDRIAVMYAGELIEIAPATSIFEKQLHPYTQGFFNSLPARGLQPIKGSSSSLIDIPDGYRFHPRCNHCVDRCKTEHSYGRTGWQACEVFPLCLRFPALVNHSLQVLFQNDQGSGRCVLSHRERRDSGPGGGKR